jgi:hypothetical protein
MDESKLKADMEALGWFYSNFSDEIIQLTKILDKSSYMVQGMTNIASIRTNTIATNPQPAGGNNNIVIGPWISRMRPAYWRNNGNVIKLPDYLHQYVLEEDCADLYEPFDFVTLAGIGVRIKYDLFLRIQRELKLKYITN